LQFLQHKESTPGGGGIELSPEGVCLPGH